MTYVLIILLAVLIIWAVCRTVARAKKGGGCCGEREEAARKAPVSDRNRAHYPHTLLLDIGGMTCENCARRVENALNGLDGVWASVDIGHHRARVRCKDHPDEQALKQAVRQAGYVVTGVTREA